MKNLYAFLRKLSILTLILAPWIWAAFGLGRLLAADANSGVGLIIAVIIAVMMYCISGSLLKYQEAVAAWDAQVAKNEALASELTNMRNNLRLAKGVVVPADVRKAFRHIDPDEASAVRIAACWYIIELGQPRFTALLLDVEEAEIREAAAQALASQTTAPVLRVVGVVEGGERVVAVS